MRAEKDKRAQKQRKKSPEKDAAGEMDEEKTNEGFNFSANIADSIALVGMT